MIPSSRSEPSDFQYDTGKHCVFYHRDHIVWSTKYRYKVLAGSLRLRVRDICRQVGREKEVDILRRLLPSDHVHMFVSVPEPPPLKWSAPMFRKRTTSNGNRRILA